MKENRKHRRIVVFLALLLAGTLLGACGNSNKKSTSPASARPGSGSGMSTCTMPYHHNG
jgi:hypothetical protein